MIVAHLLTYPRWPLLVYPAAVSISGTDPAALFEALFTRNGWPAAWRDGVFPVHHYHSNSHEVLGIYNGEVTVQFGGDAGVKVVARPGDVIVLPAGAAHKKLSSKGDLGVVGAYPVGSRPDTCFSPFGAIAVAVPLPSADPVFGKNGPLFEHWRD